MEVIDGMQVVIEAGFSPLFGAKTAAVVEPTLDNEDVESTLGKIRAEHEAVMAGANDDAIVVAFEGVQVCSLVLCFCAPLRRSESCGQDRKNTGYSAQRRADGKSGKEPFNVARCRGALGQIFIPYRHGGPIRENEGWPKRDPGARIVSAHDRRHVVAADEQAWNRFAHFGQYPAIGVGLQTHAGS